MGQQTRRKKKERESSSIRSQNEKVNGLWEKKQNKKKKVGDLGRQYT